MMYNNQTTDCGVYDNALTAAARRATAGLATDAAAAKGHPCPPPARCMRMGAPQKYFQLFYEREAR